MSESFEDLSIPQDIGEVEILYSGIVSASISGQTVQLQSGTTIVVGGGVSVSGSIVEVSGQTIQLQSGTSVIVGGGVNVSGSPVKISGETIQVASGAFIAGNFTILSGYIDILSGSVIANVSGSTVQLPSTQPVKVSGETIIITSGAVIHRDLLSGVGVLTNISVSGNVVKISGETVGLQSPVGVKTGAIIPSLSDLSGGIVMASGAVKSVTIKALKYNSGVIYVGGSGNEAPYSGRGFPLDPSEGVTLDVDNFDAVYVLSTVSGFGGVGYIGVN